MTQEKNCKKCGYVWISRKDNPRQCPKCKNIFWNKNDDVKQFGTKIIFEVGIDMLEYKIDKEISNISKELERILEKSNSTCVKDLLKDMYESFDNISLLKKGE